jgi:transcription elongation factor Elf1
MMVNTISEEQAYEYARQYLPEKVPTESTEYQECFFRCHQCGNEEVAIVKTGHNIRCENCGERMACIEVLGFMGVDLGKE